MARRVRMGGTLAGGGGGGRGGGLALSQSTRGGGRGGRQAWPLRGALGPRAIVLVGGGGLPG